MHSSSNSLELNSYCSQKENVNEQIITLNNQFLTVRRPNENNVLEFLNADELKKYDQVISSKQIEQKNIDKLDQSPPVEINIQEMELNDLDAELLDEENGSPQISSKALNNLAEQNQAQKLSLVEQVLDQFPLKSQPKITSKLRDLGSDFEAIRIHNQQFLKTWLDLILFIFLSFYYFDISINICLLKQDIYHLAFYIILLVLSILHLLQQIYIKRTLDTLMETIIIVLQFIRIFENHLAINILLLSTIYFIIQKLISIREILIRQFYYYVKSIELTLYYLFFVHIFACIFNLVSDLQGEDWQTKYVLALFWAISTSTTIGQNIISLDTQGQRIAQIVLITFMILFFVYFFLSFNLVNDEYHSHFEKRQLIKNYFNNRKIPNSIQTHSLNYLDKKWKVSDDKLSNENKLLAQLPILLQEQIQYAKFSESLLTIPFMRKLSQECQYDLVLAIKELIYPAEHQLEDNGLYFCLEGELKLYLNDYNLVKVLKQGDCIGQTFLFYQQHHPYIVVTNQLTRLAYLDNHKFITILSNYPQDYQLFRMELDRDILDINLVCHVCDQPNHRPNDCPHTHYIPNKLEIIANYLHSETAQRVAFKRNSNRKTNAKFGRRICEDVASMCQELINSANEQSLEPSDNMKVKYLPYHKQSRSLDSESKYQKSSSHHTISVIPKQYQNSALSQSSFNLLKDVSRKISKQQQDSDKVSSNSVNKQTQNHKQSSSNSQKETSQHFRLEDQVIDDSLLVAHQRRKKSSIGKMLSLKDSPPQFIIDPMSQIREEDERSLLQQYSYNSSKRYTTSQPQKGSLYQSSGLQQQINLDVFFEYPAQLDFYFPDQNINQVIEKFTQQ